MCILLASLAGRATAQTTVPEFVGAWNVTIYDPYYERTCVASFLVNADGGIVANSCYADMSPGYGQWIRTGRREYTVTFFGVIYGDYGFGDHKVAAETYKIRATVVVTPDGLKFSGPSKIDTYLMNGNQSYVARGYFRAQRFFVEEP